MKNQSGYLEKFIVTIPHASHEVTIMESEKNYLETKYILNGETEIFEVRNYIGE